MKLCDKHKEIDVRPTLTYKGRRIEVETDGTFQNTKVKIDGKEQRCIIRMTIVFAPGFVKVYTTRVDVELP